MSTADILSSQREEIKCVDSSQDPAIHTSLHAKSLTILQFAVSARKDVKNY